MAEHVVDRPGFDEYVVARGADLLRTAWLLVGDDAAAHRLVRMALSRAWPQWSHLAEHGAGSYDTDLRRFLVQAHLRRHRRDADEGRHPHRHDDKRRHPRRHNDEGRHQRKSVAAHPDSHDDPGRPQRLRELEPLDALSRVERTVVVLVLFDRMGEGQVADLLDDDVGSIRRHLVHGLALLRDRFDLDERSVRGLLESLAPDDPPVDRLLSRDLGRAGRWRGVRGWALAVAALATTALVVSLLPQTSGGGTGPTPAPSTRSTPEPAVASCQSSAGQPAPPRPLEPPLSSRYVAVLVCAETDDGSVWSGSLPPDVPVSDPLALDSLVLTPRGSGAPCPKLSQGPAFRLLLLGRDGTTTTWTNEALACNGWPALAQVYAATAEQGAKAGPGDVGFLGCPTTLGHPLDELDPGAATRLAKGTVFVEATVCLHPLAQARPSAIPRYRAVRGNVLGAPDLAQLNAELAKAGARRTATETCSEGPNRFVIRARTTTGRVVELSSTCGREFAVDGHARDSWRAGADTTSMVRALLIAN